MQNFCPSFQLKNFQQHAKYFTLKVFYKLIFYLEASFLLGQVLPDLLVLEQLLMVKFVIK
jgi:hypothetical protein